MYESSIEGFKEERNALLRFQPQKHKAERQRERERERDSVVFACVKEKLGRQHRDSGNSPNASFSFVAVVVVVVDGVDVGVAHKERFDVTQLPVPKRQPNVLRDLTSVVLVVRVDSFCFTCHCSFLVGLISCRPRLSLKVKLHIWIYVQKT